MAFTRSPLTKQGDVAKELKKKAGKYLKGLREDAGLTQAQLAKALDLEYYTFISQLETGLTRVPPERLKDYAKALKVDPQEFAAELMRYYDPYTHAVLFGSKPPKL